MSESETESEDDYMSNDLIAEIEQKDVRPGLLFSTQTARKHALEKKKAEADAINAKKAKPEPIQASLSKPIVSDNKGFAMLAKMGYKEGSGLGKSGDGIKEPVPLSIKNDRGGLGLEAEVKKRKQKSEKMISEIRGIRMQAMQAQREKFRHEKKSEFHDKRLNGVLRKIQKVCHKLDTEHGMETPSSPYFWPPAPPEDTEESETLVTEIEDAESEEIPEVEDDAVEVDVKLKVSTLECYLLEQYRYCIWCCALFTDEEDQKSYCPGVGPEAHGEYFT